jgi:hypothetical protein
MNIIRNKTGTIINAMVLAAKQVAHENVRCPVCGEMDFKKWPEGWDGHAGSKCAALTATTPEARRKQFKDAARHLFG